MKKILTILAVATLLITTQTNSVHAQSNFSLAFSVKYQFDKHGNALVNKHITLTNLNTDTYPSVYLVDVPDDASDISAFNEDGKLEIETLQEGGRTMVRIPIDDQNVGVNEKTKITLSFNTRKLASNEGGNWQIGIPPFSADENVISYDTSISTADAWGEVSYISPDSETYGTWTLSERGEDPIILVFGQIQPVTTTTDGDSSVNPIIVSGGIILGIGLTILLYYVFSRKINK